MAFARQSRHRRKDPEHRIQDRPYQEGPWGILRMDRRHMEGAVAKDRQCDHELQRPENLRQQKVRPLQGQAEAWKPWGPREQWQGSQELESLPEQWQQKNSMVRMAFDASPQDLQIQHQSRRRLCEEQPVQR